ncbi:chemotaxis protein CheD [Geomonas paludis]|uniref:Probable chemoreceptor glutamine deamidase CheD n=1 Tax=Geomonas paludis TaxID=2740185 RepID=A0A6V8MW23_9BACT|nr:chemotaxis protein CheD [Geomonas paludis]UPU37374.1 chemotaxis protein CheD [Geomonas paludis]GFO64064.1 putative chemoreceptor glutamine deamidase CheD 1 [Geomonas paludis]
MKVEKYQNGERVTIAPGEFYVTGKPGVITTLLGSCIAACLYDPGRRLIGMNHFMLSNPRYSKELPLNITDAGRYGIHAMDLLINAMMANGTDRFRIRAKIFGGATIINPGAVTDNFFCVGQVNCRFILQYLEKERIPIDAMDIGGDFGRVIHFSNGDFSVHRRKVDSSRSSKLAERDRYCWQKAIEQQQAALTEVDLW